MKFGRLQQWMNLFGILKYGIFLALVLILLPFTAFEKAWFHRLLGGLFHELELWGIFLASISLVLAAWSLMFTQGLIIDGIEARWKKGGAMRRPNINYESGYIPGKAEKFFSVPVTWGQLLAYTTIAVPGLLITVTHSKAEWFLALLVAFIGIFVAYLITIMLCVPARLAKEEYEPLPDPMAKKIWSWLSRVSFLKKFFKFLRRLISLILEGKGIFHIHYLLELEDVGGVDKQKRLCLSDHFFALTNVAGLLILLAVSAWLFRPPAPKVGEPPALAYLYILIILFIWTLGAIDFHLSRLRISPLLVLVIIMIVGYAVKTDHYYDVNKVNKKRVDTKARLTPVEVAKGSRGGKNLVVVTSTGGGILAAGWSTLALKNLILAHPQLVKEIRLLSTVSGGSVGAAYYIHGLLRHSENSILSQRELQDIFEKATTDSLSAIAYGFAFLDFWRLVSGGQLPVFTDRDRGLLLEEKWAYTAARAKDKGFNRTVDSTGLLSLREDIREGRIPAPIFNTTIMESGRRVMITPIEFNRTREPSEHAKTLSEFFFAKEEKAEADLRLWTAARLSATFPYVTPAARAKFWPLEKRSLNDYQSHHFIDGGYYDNYGITSALDWLKPVLEARLNEEEGLQFERVVIIQLRVSQPQKQEDFKPKKGVISALVGPLLGLVNIRDGAAFSRNEIELNRFLTSWNELFSSKKINVSLKTVIFQPPEGQKGPLSWHLTDKQIKQLNDIWPEEMQRWPPEIRSSWKEMEQYLYPEM